MGQLPRVLVCEVTFCDDDDDEEEFDDVDEPALLVLPVATTAVESSDSPDSSDSCSAEARLEVLAELRVLALAAAVCVVVVAWPSCHASTPPSDSIEAMLNAVTALRARAARGLRCRRPAPARGTAAEVGAEVGAEVCSSMTVNVRTGGEGAARAG
jgi:hypothetical protein